jgi:hypothetical protein
MNMSSSIVDGRVLYDEVHYEYFNVHKTFLLKQSVSEMLKCLRNFILCEGQRTKTLS